MASKTLFDLSGGSSKKKKAAPRPFRKITKRDIERQALKQAGAWDYAKKLKEQPTDLEQLLKAGRFGPGIASGLSRQEQQQFEADLSFLGILPGRTAGTLPERLVAKYLWGKGLPYEGMGYSARLNQGWAFQYPTLGGRSNSGGGAVLDIAVSKTKTTDGKPLGIRANGSYWHHLPGAPQHDARQKADLERAGWTVLDLWDYEIEVPGVLDAKLRPALR